VNSISDREWDAAAYDVLADPQRTWGRAVLDRLPLRGDETVLDAGCGAGGLTAELLERLPRGRVIAVDASRQMTALTRERLEPRFGPRIRVLTADLSSLELDSAVDAIFSNAVFHHVADHRTLFGCMYRALVPGGRLIAQCGGGPNLVTVRAHIAAVAANDPLLAPLVGWDGPWNNADADTTAARLRSVGFCDIETSVTPAPVPFADTAHLRAHLTTIILRSHLHLLGPEPAPQHLLDGVIARMAADQPPLTLDHWRLNISARRPAA
jgi:trans-aconitate 2-methyltransferase